MPGEEDVRAPVTGDEREPAGTTARGRERGEGVGELSPLPDDAGGDAPPERDALAEIEAATGRLLSDDLTAEATHHTADGPPEDCTAEGGQP